MKDTVPGTFFRIATLGSTAMFAAGLATTAACAESKVEMNAVTEDGVGKSIGHVLIKEENGGLVFEPQLRGLSPGIHGFHVHEYGDCGPLAPDGERGPAKAAGGHLDPDGEGEHSPPWADNGHLGDLPALYAENDGTASHPVHVSELRMSDIKGHALMVHEGGDNYADEPEPLGGGGERAVCGVIPE